MKDTCKQTSQHRRARRVELICTRGDQPKLRIRIFQQTSRARSLGNPTQQDFSNAHTLPIYKCHTRFKFWRTFQSTLCDIVYNQEGTPKMKHMLIFWEMRDSSMSFTPILPKPSHHTIHKVYCQEHNSLYPILWVTTRYSCSKRCDTFCQDCTFLEACIPRKTRDAYD